MARGKNRGGRGGFRGSDDSRGRGRGGQRGGRGFSRGRGRGGPVYDDDFDFPIQQWPSNNPPTPPPNRGRGFASPRNRGRGRALPFIPFQVYSSPLRGLGSPRGSRGRGEGLDRTSSPHGRGRNLNSKLNAGAPLSRLLYEDRPYLKPIVFVRSVYTATLFEQEEDIFQSVVEAAVDGDVDSHVPTADAVYRVFNPLDNNADISEDGEEQGGEDKLEEIDFSDIGRIQAQVDAAAAKQTASTTSVTTVKHESASFFVDTTPAAVTHSHQSTRIAVDRLDGALGSTTLDQDEDDEVIVYVAPHPRNGRSSPSLDADVPPAAPLASSSLITGTTIGSSHTPLPTSEPAITVDEPPKPAFHIEMGTLYPEPTRPSTPPNLGALSPDASQLPPPPSFESVSFSFNKTTTVQKQTRRLHPVGTPRSLLQRSRQPRRKSLRGFGMFGAKHEEAMLREVDPRRDEQRRGDSDVNWGTSDEDDDIDELSNDMGGMELDGDTDLAAMKRFVHSMSAEGSNHVTMDDVADMERMRLEDEEEDVRGPESADEEEIEVNGQSGEDVDDDDDEEVEGVVRMAEEVLIGEAEGDEGLDEEDDDEDEDEDEDSFDDEVTPKRHFQARLERLRASTTSGKGKGKARATDDDSDDDAMSLHLTWADDDEDYLDHIQELLDENAHILTSGSRKARKYMFKAIQNGDFEDMLSDMMEPAKRGKNKHVPPELQEQWEKDRQKKAENKQKRALERLMLAADPMATHKGGKKGQKAMLAAARAAQDLPNRIVDFVTLEQQIRRFLEDIGGRDTMALPPTDKATRKRVHELATAFGLKSQSKGKGDARYTTLIKTSRSGIAIKEGKIRRIMKEATNGSWQGPGRGSRGNDKAMSLAKHREGEEIGKGAAKIDDSNIGFKLLSMMGWSDGERIGLSGGLEAPLTAVMKKTKLGLGATM